MKPINQIYLDYNATTPCDPLVVAKMLPYFSEIYGNPSNALHIQGRNSAKAVELARDQVANLVEAESNEIVFTSGATESDNLAILGIARINKDNARKKIITSSIEHKAVLLACKKLIEEGFELSILPVDPEGRVSLQQAYQLIDEKTLLVTIHGANNEIGTIQYVQQLAELTHQNGALFHCDGAQAVGKIPVNVNEWEVDLLSMSGHKLYGPKGVGALYIRGGVNTIPLESIWYGGGQENGIRSGTMNVPSIVGFGAACMISKNELSTEIGRIRALRDQLELSLIENIPSLKINAYNVDRLPNTSSLTFPGIDADALILNAEQIMVGTGSACTSGAIEPSHVLTAIGLSRELARSTVRVSLGRYTSNSDIVQAHASLLAAWKKLSR